MPSRILKESICTSENLAAVSAEAEVLFYRLIVKADDFGLYHGNPKIIASLLFPLKVPTERKVSAWLSELCDADLIATYTAEEDGKQYLKLLSWDKHQTRRAMKSKFPLPTDEDINRIQMNTRDIQPNESENNCIQKNTTDDENTCKQMQADSSVNENENENVFENENDKRKRERKRSSAQNGAGENEDFKRFWEAYPRKVGKTDALKFWGQLKPDGALVDKIVAGVERWSRSEQWTKDGGRFIPYPARFLRAERYNEYDRAEATPSPKSAVKNYDDGEDFLGSGK